MVFKKLRVLPAVLLMALTQVAFAQKPGPTTKPSLIGFSGNVVDFTASFPKLKNTDPGFSIFFWKGLAPRLDLSFRYNGLLSDYAKANPSSGNFVHELEGALHLRALTDNHLFNPFITAGIGAGRYGKDGIAPYAPLGGGIQVNLLSQTYFFLQANYRASLSKSKLDNNMFYSLGVAQSLRDYSEPAPKPLPPAPVVVLDKDNDGVVDSLDACPDVAGLVALKGCPDKDGDGVADNDDKCPDVPGLAKYNGCPIPDTDKDGVNDEQDKCPDVAGVAKYNGCPIPDTDKDGVNDEEDKCPALAGPASNGGCPEIKAEVKKRIEVAAKQIYFATGSAKLLAKSNKSLNEVAAILKGDENLKLDISGHTDNTGKADKNQTLSENRAKAVYDYLVSKGVTADRLASAGYGQDQPIADNKTAAGRAKNRRVELALHYN